jgi:pimeloyl-ACP methyl ester carboxylesterase
LNLDLVLPSLPGYGFSGKPQGTGWDPDHIARAWAELMGRLGYQRYVSQGGDWGAIVSHAMGRQAPVGLLGIHVNMPAVVPQSVAEALSNSDPVPSGLSDTEKAAFASLDAFYKKGTGYSAMMATRPQTLGYALADSPAGLAAWIYDKFAAWTYSGGEPERALTRDEMLDDITFYWLTNSATSSARLYWENNGNVFNAVDISIPGVRSTARHEAGPSVIITSSSIGMRSKRAVTSRRGNSRTSLLPRSARHSDHCASWSEGGGDTVASMATKRPSTSPRISMNVPLGSSVPAGRDP